MSNGIPYALLVRIGTPNPAAPPLQVIPDFAGPTLGVLYSGGALLTQYAAGAVTHSVTGGSFPTGLALASTGEATGTPTTQGYFEFEATSTDGVTTVVANYSITVKSSIVITPQLNSPEELTPYFGQVLVSDGTGPYTITETLGSFTDVGLSLNSTTGAVTGTTLSGSADTYPLALHVVDATGAYADLGASLIVAPVLTYTGTVPAGLVGVAYSAALPATHGIPPYAYVATAGTVPPGLVLGGVTGTFTGYPTTAGTYTPTVQVTDTAGKTATLTPTFVVYDPLAAQHVTIRKDFDAAQQGAGTILTAAVPYGMVITGVEVLADGISDALVFDIWRRPYGTYPPNSGDSITGGAGITFVGSRKYRDTTLSGWSTTLNAGDTLYFAISTADTNIGQFEVCVYGTPI